MAFSLWSYPGQEHFKLAEGNLQCHSAFDLSSLAQSFVISTSAHHGNVYTLPTQKSAVLKDTSPFLERQGFAFPTLSNNGAVGYQGLVTEAVEAIQASEHFDKVVLSRFHDVPVSALNSQWLNDLRKAYPTAFIAMFSDTELGTWITASPELFLKKMGGSLQSFSLAGTKFSDDTDLGEKEQQEQHFVTDYIQQVFEASGLQVTVNRGINHRAGQLIHLLNVIEGRFISGYSHHAINQLVEKLHPTPAVCGLPLHEALQFLKKEGYDRQLYTGFLGEVESIESFELYVNLRCAQWAGDRMRFYAGAGITKDSNPEQEFLETKAKMEVLKSVLLSQ